MKKTKLLTIFAVILAGVVLVAGCEPADNTGLLGEYAITVNAVTRATGIAGEIFDIATVTVPQKAKSGEEVTVTIKCDYRYEVAEYGISLSYGMEESLAITKRSNTKYTFRMPGEDATLNIKYAPRIETKTVTLEKGEYPNLSLYSYNWLETIPRNSGEWQWQAVGEVPGVKAGIVCYFGHSDEQFKFKSTTTTWGIGDAFGLEVLSEAYGIDLEGCTEGIQFYCKRADGANTFRIRLGDGTNWSRYVYFKLQTIPDRWEKVLIRWRDQPGISRDNRNFWKPTDDDEAVDTTAIKQISFALVGPEALEDDVKLYSLTGIGTYYDYGNLPNPPATDETLLGLFHHVYDFSGLDSGYGICGIEAVRFVR